MICERWVIKSTPYESTLAKRVKMLYHVQMKAIFHIFLF